MFSVQKESLTIATINSFLLISLCVAFFSTSSADAQEISEVESSKQQEASETDQEEIEKLYISYCGTVEELITLLDLPKDEKPTDTDIIQLSKMREPIMSVIRDGKSAIEKISEESEESGIGGLGVVMTCGVVDQISSRITTRGCLDLASNNRIFDGPGLKICKEIIEAVNKK